MTMTSKLQMSLSLDLDNKWSYLKTHGSNRWYEYESYFDLVVPRILEFLDDRGLKITFFIVGQDAVFEKNHAALQAIRDAGHEIGSHSFNHEPWLHLYSEQDLEAELEKAEQAIAAATGVSVDGFRGPGFSLSESTLNVLQRRGYRYDATAFPNILNPLARAYFFAKSNLDAEEKKRRKALFGSYSDAFRPVKPYAWKLPAGRLLELPVSTMPFFRTPVHFSYLIYLATYSVVLTRAYMRLAIVACKLTRTEPSLLLHPLDFMGHEDDSDLQFFPAMSMSVDHKLALMSEFFDRLLENFKPTTVGEYVDQINADQSIKVLSPRFSH